jgi:hypothetical protein
MCGLCGVFLGEEGWSDTALTSMNQGGRTRRHERLHRVALANRVLGPMRMQVADWNGASYTLRGQTGQTVIVHSIAELWPAAEKLRRSPIDPLDPDVIESMERAR